MILVEYRCASCAYMTEMLATWPFPTDQACAQCGAPARRVYSTAGLRRSRSSARPAGPAQDGCCRDVPGACALPPEVAQVWAARVAGDGEALTTAMLRQEQSLERTRQTPQELAATIGKPTSALGPLSVPNSG